MNGKWLSLWTVLFYTALAVSLPAQTPVEERLLEAQQDVSEQSELFEILAELRQHPLDLNRVSRRELQAIPGLPDALADSIIAYRSRHGRFESVAQLSKVTGIDQQLLSYLKEITAIMPSLPSRFTWRSRVSRTLDLPVGYRDGTYAGGPEKLYHRVTLDYQGKLQGGFLLEKDAGETRLDDLGLFFASARLHPAIQFFIGDYQLRFGQGLALWGPYGFAKGADATYPVRKQARPLSSYLTVDENASLHGVAVAAEFARWNVTAFASHKRLDASLQSRDAAVGLASSGLHRNDRELSRKDSQHETLFGARVQHRVGHWLELGATFFQSTFDPPFQDPDSIRSRFEFRGQLNRITSLDWAIEWQELELFGELARSQNSGRALLAGARLRLGQVALAALHRNYAANYQNFRAFAFGERNGATQNERGFYLGLSYRPWLHTEINAYYDTWRFPWRSFFEPVPTGGHEMLLQVEQRLHRRVHATLRLRRKQREENDTRFDALGRETSVLQLRTQTQFRLQLDVRLLRHVRWRTRAELNQVRIANYSTPSGSSAESGALLYQQLRWQSGKQWDVVARLSLFDTDSFASSVYQYENDLPGVVTNRALFGRGVRWFLLLRWRPARALSLSFRYSESVRRDVDALGSGTDLIAGNRDRRVGAQVDVIWR